MTLPDKSCPTFGIAPGTGLKLFVEGDLILEELVILKFSIDDWCCGIRKHLRLSALKDSCSCSS